MLDILKEKIVNWSSEGADIFHNHLPRDNYDNHDGNYIWEHTNEGIYLTRRNNACFLGFDGVIYKLTNLFYDNDWKMNTVLYEHCIVKGVRMDIPIECSYIKFAGVNLQYSITHRPNHQLGDDYNKDLFLGKVDTEYFLEFIDDATQILSIIKEVSKENNYLCPSVGFNVFHRNRDSMGNFWLDLKKWALPYDKLIDRQFTDLEDISLYAKHNIVNIDTNKIFDYARQKWNTIR